MNNRELYDTLIERAMEDERVKPQKVLVKLLRKLEHFLTSWGFFDEQ